MSKIVKKWRKVVGGCSTKTHRQSLIENDFLLPSGNDEFVFKRGEKCPVQNGDFPIYNEYDNLERGKNQSCTNTKRTLKDSTNTSYARGLKRFFKSVDKADENQAKEFLQKDPNNNEFEMNPQSPCIMQESPYCEIQDISSLFSDNQPLIELNKEQLKKTQMTDSKVNLFIKGENEEQADDQPMVEANPDKDEITQNLTDLRLPDSFESRSEAIFWYLNLLHDRMAQCVKLERALNANEQAKRTHVITAHLLYSRNYYEMRTREAVTAMSVDARTRLDNMHPCLVALACLLDSDAVRIVDSHTCACDSYLYLFATRVKFCAWKTKLFVILKRPKRSSIERLNLIEDLMNCRKIMNNH